MQQNHSQTLTRPTFLITIDTEGDNLWGRSEQITTDNARYLPRFQALCEKYGLKTTWLVNYEMAECPAFREFAWDVLSRSQGEIGMHLHAWNSPPLVPLTDDDFRNQPYLIEYLQPVMRDKIAFLTDLLEDRFERKMLSHRAGRWGFNAVYARLLVAHGYQVDCSVTPHISWAEYLGDPNGAGGPDFSGFPELPYYVDLEQIDRQGDSPLLEVPVSAIKTKYARLHTRLRSIPRGLRRISGWLWPPVLAMFPRDKRRNLSQMHTILHHALEHQWPCVQLAIHSSELMPGGSPFFPSFESVQRLYDRLEILFSSAANSFRGATLSEFRQDWCESQECCVQSQT